MFINLISELEIPRANNLQRGPVIGEIRYPGDRRRLPAVPIDL